MSGDESDVPQLSAHTFAALQEFYREQEEKNTTELLEIEDKNTQIEENWQLSQFWYDDATANTLAKIAIESTGKQGKIALISCPTLYQPIKDVKPQDTHVDLYEYDRRFAIFGEHYIFYDYNKPLDIPKDKKNYYDLVIADPPFLSEECMTKTAITIKNLAKNKIVICSGVILEDLVRRLLHLEKTQFEPKHRNNLANEFVCYSNFDIGHHIE